VLFSKDPESEKNISDRRNVSPEKHQHFLKTIFLAGFRLRKKKRREYGGTNQCGRVTLSFLSNNKEKKARKKY
jgi:hypothetical protein